MKNSTASHNQVVASVSDTTDSGPDGVALEADGPSTIQNTQITANTTTVTAAAGLASAQGAFFDLDGDPGNPVVLTNSVIANNTMRATSIGGDATVQGGGITNSGTLQLQNDQIASNIGIANGSGGWAQGGGIWNGPLFGSPPVLLTISHTTIQHNSVDGSGIAASGGGLYTAGFPVTLTQSTISQNNPDNCAGC
jgi:hypothetical protein